MADGARTQVKNPGVRDSLNAMVSRARNIRSYLNTVVVRQYQDAQMKRFQTENESEGATWVPLTPRYLAQKLIKYAESPGGGRKMLIATGRLSDAALMRGEGYYKIVDNRSIRIGIDDGMIPYAKYVARTRPFMTFGSDTLAQMRAGIKNFIRKGNASWRAG